MAKHLKTKQGKKGIWIAVLLVSAALLIAALVFLLPQLLPAPEDKAGVAAATALPSETETEAPAQAAEESTETEEPALAENPIDWKYYQDINEDVYAWIYIPETGIDLPVLQSQGPEDDNLYLHHDINRNYLFAGEIYSQKKNAKDFSDPVTVLYGHNMKKEGERFTNLLYFEDEEFFNDNEFFYIYTPGHILTYRIFSAHGFDTRHILNNFDFSTEEGFREYITTILSPRSMIVNIREGVTISVEDHIVTLSTCAYVGTEKIRYLVHGVLVDDQLTEENLTDEQPADGASTDDQPAD